MEVLFQRAVRIRSHVKSYGTVFHANSTESTTAIGQEWVWNAQERIIKRLVWLKHTEHRRRTDKANERKEAGFGQILYSPGSVWGRKTEGHNTGSLPLRKPTAWWGNKSVDSRLINAIPKVRTRCSGSSVFGTSARNGFLAEETREFRRTGGLKKVEEEGCQRQLMLKKQAGARWQKDVYNLWTNWKWWWWWHGLHIPGRPPHVPGPEARWFLIWKLCTTPTRLL